MGGSMASASSSYRRAGDINNTNTTANEEAEGITMDDSLTTANSGDIKPRSLRFTWSMKTTSSMDPADMMKEIRKVRNYFLFYLIEIFIVFILNRFSI